VRGLLNEDVGHYECSFAYEYGSESEPVDGMVVI
jgi:hypothetical protein